MHPSMKLSVTALAFPTLFPILAKEATSGVDSVGILDLDGAAIEF
jgi:hypothetical protein